MLGSSGFRVLLLAGAVALGACAAAGDTPSGGRSGRGGTSPTGTPGGTAGGTSDPGDFMNSDPNQTPSEPPRPVNIDIGMGEECAAVAEMAKNEIRPVDIIWAIDSSPSMTAVIDSMAMQMNNLVNTVTMAGIKVHIIFITAEQREDPIFNLPTGPVICIPAPTGSGSCPNDTKLPDYHHLMGDCCWVGSHNALSRLVETYPMYMGDLQPNSMKYFGAVTDDSAGDTTDFKGQADKFVADVAGWAGMPMVDWKFFGIINPSLGGAYQMLADLSGGVTGMIALGMVDYSMVFNELAKTVTQVKQLSCEWAIPPIPDGAGEFNKYKVNVMYTPGDGSGEKQLGKLEEADCAKAPEGGWYYDDENAPTSVRVCGQNCDQIKVDLMGRVDVLFGCDTIKAPI
jgi:hypothetical protein